MKNRQAQRVLITGHTGFIGSSLLQYHKMMDDDVKGISKSTGTDVRSSELDVKNFDLIYHCASTVNDYNFLSGDSLDIDTNCIGTHRLLEALRKENPWARFVYVSSFFANGDPPYLPVTEETPCHPKGTYGASKLFCENMCKTYYNVFDMDTVIARITNVYGPGNSRASKRTSAMNWMIQQLATGHDVYLYDNGSVRRDYLYIDDAVCGLASVADRGFGGETYFLSTGIGCSFKYMLSLIDGPGRLKYTPSPGFHSRIGIGDFWALNEKVYYDTGWKPDVSIEEGIGKTVDYYRSI